MNNSIISQRFIKCHDQLRENKVIKSSRQFAIELDYLPQSLSEIIKERRDVTIELIRKAVEVYRMNPIYIFTGEGDYILPAQKDGEPRVLTVVTDENSEERIVHVPALAYAGYVLETNNNNFIQSLPTFTLPDYKYKVGTHRSFDVSGDSMEPTLFEGDKVVCSYIDPLLWETAIKESFVYVIVTKDDIIIRRVYNELKTNKLLQLKTDNSFYEIINTPLSNIKEIWYVRAKISPFLPSPVRVQKDFMEEINALKETLREQSSSIGNINETIDKIVKQV